MCWGRAIHADELASAKVLGQGQKGWVFFLKYLKNTESNFRGQISDIFFFPALRVLKAVSDCLKEEQILRQYFWIDDSSINFTRAETIPAFQMSQLFRGVVNKCSCDFGRRAKYIHPFKEKKKHVSFNAS